MTRCGCGDELCELRTADPELWRVAQRAMTARAQVLSYLRLQRKGVGVMAELDAARTRELSVESYLQAMIAERLDTTR